MSGETISEQSEVLSALPTDSIRAVMWRYADRQELSRLVQATRQVARGDVARLVTEGARSSPEWNSDKGRLLEALEAAGVTSIVAEPEYGGFAQGSRNLAMALAAFELAWVDGGAAKSGLAASLALEPIVEQGTPEQAEAYLSRCVPRGASAGRPARGAFCLTEPLPYVGVDTGILGGKVRVARWDAGQEPLLKVEKRGRFISNMDFANFVVAAVESDDERIRGSCMVILEEGDEGTFDRGPVTHKLVHQLSSTRDPVFDLTVPASRIVGGYTIEDGVIIPQFSHGRILETVLGRTRVPVALMTAAKLLSAIEPMIRYHRERFRGGPAAPGSPRHDLGLQTKEDVLHRVIDICATGEAAASLGFAAARQWDRLDLLRQQTGPAADSAPDVEPAGRSPRDAIESRALEYLQLQTLPADEVDHSRLARLQADPQVQQRIAESVAKVLAPAAKLWNTGHGAATMREAVSLLGGAGITEESPGFLAQKWMDAQLESIYEGPESVQRRQLIVTMTSPIFLAQLQQWITRMRQIASDRPGTGACAVASAMDLWLWTYRHLQEATDADGKPLYRDARQGAVFPLADALCWLLAARYQILDVLQLESAGSKQPAIATQLPAYLQWFHDLCHVQTARAAGEVGRICSELVYGYVRHPSWEPSCEACVQGDEIDCLEGLIPGISFGARIPGDVLEADGTHAEKAGPCPRFTGIDGFIRRRSKLDGCLTGTRLAKDRAAQMLTRVPIPQEADY